MKKWELFNTEKNYTEKVIEAFESYQWIKKKKNCTEIDLKLIEMMDDKILYLFEQ